MSKRATAPTGRGAGRWRSLPALLLFTTIVGLGFLGARTPGQTRPATAPPVDVGPTTLPAIRYVACYQQPLEYLAQWKARGCNAAVGPELGNPPRTTGAKWCAEAQRLGLGVIGNSSLLKDKFVPPNLVAWICDDEPNETNHIATQPPAYIAAQAAAFRALNPSVPVLLNLAGDRLTIAGARDHPVNEAYIRSADVVLADWYPINREANRYPLTFKRDELAYLSAHGAKEVGSFVETTWQWLNNGDARGRQPTPDEVEQEVSLATGAGARWVIYFSTTPGGHWGWPLSYDTTPPGVEVKLSTINAQLNPPIIAPPPTTQPGTPDVHPGLPPSTTPTTVPIAENLKPLVPPATLPAPGIAPGKVVRVFCDSNPTPIPGPNPDWLGGLNPATGKADRTIPTNDPDGRPLWVRANRATQYLADLGCRQAFFVYDGTLNRSSLWSDARGNLLPVNAPGTSPDTVKSMPPTEASVRACAKLAQRTAFYGDAGAPFRPMIFDLETARMGYDPAAPLAARRQVLSDWIQTLRWARAETVNTVPLYMYWSPPFMGAYDADVDMSDVGDLYDQLRRQLSGVVVSCINGDPETNTDGESWFEHVRNVDTLIARQCPEFRRAKIAIVNPLWHVDNPASELWAPRAARNRQPLPIELWRRQLRYLVDHDWDVLVWVADVNPAEPVREHLEYAASLGRN